MKNTLIHSYLTKQEAAYAAFLQIKTNIEKSSSFNLAVSGGSSPLLLFQLLSDWLQDKPDQSAKLGVCWVDERVVPYNSARSNYGEAVKVWPDLVNYSRTCPFPENLDPLEIPHVYFNRMLERGFIIDEKLHLDLAILGMGSDGHTASIFPGTDLINKNRWFATCYFDAMSEWRATMTIEALRNAVKRIALVFGEDKLDMLKKCFQKEEDLPFALLMDSPTTIYSDFNV